MRHDIYQMQPGLAPHHYGQPGYGQGFQLDIGPQTSPASFVALGTIYKAVTLGLLIGLGGAVMKGYTFRDGWVIGSRVGAVTGLLMTLYGVASARGQQDQI